MLKTLRWWQGLEAWQLVMVLAAIYLIWWTIDKYYRAIQKMRADLIHRMDERDKEFRDLINRCD